MRFKCDESLSKWWSNCGRYPDALKWIPNQAIKVSGFSVFAASETTNSSYDMQYEVRVNDSVVIAKTPVFRSPPFEETYFCRIKMEELVDVPAGAGLEITVWIALNMSDNSYVNTYSGNNGESFNDLENEHKGLFKIEGSG